MAVQKSRSTHARAGKRRSHDRISSKQITACQHCKQPKRAHRVCSHCGYYAGVEVVETEE